MGVMIMHFYSATAGPLSAGLIRRCGDFVIVYCRLGVESFFVLAGFFLAHTFRPTEAQFFSVLRHVERRLLRLAIPYWTVVAILYFAALAANVLLRRTNTMPTTSQVAATAMFTQDIFFNSSSAFFTLWSMAPMFQFYIVWAFTYWMVRRTAIWLDPVAYQVKTQRMMIGVTYLVILGSLVVAAIHPTEGWQLPGWAWAFAVGALTYWRARRLTGWRLYTLVIGALFPAAMLLGAPGLAAAKVSVCSAMLLAFEQGIQVPECVATRVLGYIGHRSYSLYLVHGPVGFRVIGWAWRLSADGKPYASVSVFIASLAASVAAGMVFYRLVEQPVARLALKVEYRR